MVDLGGAGWFAYRAVNKFSRSRFAGHFGAARKPVTQLVKARFKGRYVASNAILQDYVTANLADLGYPVFADSTHVDRGTDGRS
jgi:hypothetical protein